MYRQLSAGTHQSALHGGFNLGINLLRLVYQQETSHLTDSACPLAGIINGDVLIIQPVQIAPVLHHFRGGKSRLDGFIGNGEKLRRSINIGNLAIAHANLAVIRVNNQIFDVIISRYDRPHVIRL